MAIDQTGGPADGALYQAWNIAGNQYFPAQFNRSLDGGTTWSTPSEYGLGSSIRPVFGTMQVHPDGSVYVAGAPNSSQTTRLFVLRSADASDPDVPVPTFENREIPLTSGAVVLLLSGQGPNPGGLLSQISIAIDSSTGPTAGYMYVSASVRGMFGGFSTPTHVAIFRSRDGGQTWDPPVRANSTGSTPQHHHWFVTIDVAPNGRLDVVYNSNVDAPGGEANLNRTYYTFSHDGGETFAPAVPIGPLWNSHLGWPQQNKIGDYYGLRSDLTGANLIYAATYSGQQDVYFARIGPYDCNGNGINDDLDIIAGAADCDNNGIPDSCDIAAGLAVDRNRDGIPDACQCLADLSGSSDPNDPGYGTPDGQIDSADFFYFLDQFVGGNVAIADLSGSTDPNDPGYGVPDGLLDASDFFYYLDLFVQGCP